MACMMTPWTQGKTLILHCRFTLGKGMDAWIFQYWAQGLSSYEHCRWFPIHTWHSAIISLSRSWVFLLCPAHASLTESVWNILWVLEQIRNDDYVTIKCGPCLVLFFFLALTRSDPSSCGAHQIFVYVQRDMQDIQYEVASAAAGCLLYLPSKEQSCSLFPTPCFSKPNAKGWLVMDQDCQI